MRESRTLGSVRAKAEWLSYSTIPCRSAKSTKMISRDDFLLYQSPMTGTCGSQQSIADGVAESVEEREAPSPPESSAEHPKYEFFRLR